MKLILKILAIVLLIINSAGAFYGGFQLISDPSGSGLQLPLSFLNNSPFTSYLVPGIVLLAVNGIYGMVALAALFFRWSRWQWFIIVQGVLLTGWIFIQMMLLRMFYPPLHATFLVLGGCLIVCGLYLRRVI